MNFKILLFNLIVLSVEIPKCPEPELNQGTNIKVTGYSDHG